MNHLLFWIVFIPFLSSLILRITALFDKQKKVGENFYAFFGVLSPVISMIFSFILAFNDTVLKETLFSWINVGVLNIEFSLMLDRLSTVMILFILFIGTLIHIYAVGYMKGDKRFGEFFAYFNFFMGSMLLLVLADSPIIMFIGWELVGLASFLLIGFYFEDPLNMKAANKAFILNRVGDFGFIAGLAILFISLGGGIFSFEEIKSHIELIDTTTLTLIGFLLFVGAM
jgi:NADH-quinone oxidoreductase subunit L